MRIAIPVTRDRLCPHFGHAEAFAFIDVDEKEGNIDSTKFLNAPDHQPGLLPAWLKEEGANLVIAGGMGMRARNIFTQHGIEVVVGAADGSSEEIVKAYLAGKLETGDNICDH
ncbi:NifB/NifX family molybdenum-iron cluster-binding protein [candidate division KSB1 bacterium]